jgi:hypothetical protein
MKPTRILLFTLLALFLLPPSSFILAQGPLTPPPGAPAPTMKTLDQLDAKLEARTPISSAPFTINAPGSYYLTGNLAVSDGDAIVIATSGVTIDLAGFTISSSSAPAAGTGILIKFGVSGITIKNGHIKGGVTFNGVSFSAGPGFHSGINYVGGAPTNVLISGLTVSGCSALGINLGTSRGSVVQHCTVNVVAETGISARNVAHCAAGDCGVAAIVADAAQNCHGAGGLGGRGISAGVADNCTGTAVTGEGIFANAASNCAGTSITGVGLFTQQLATGCRGNSDSGAYGLHSLGSASNSSGIVATAGVGLRAVVANNCTGTSSFGTGLFAEQNASGCSGKTSTGTYGMDVGGTATHCSGVNSVGAGAIAIRAPIAIGCTTFGGVVSSPNKFLGTP